LHVVIVGGGMVAGYGHLPGFCRLKELWVSLCEPRSSVRREYRDLYHFHREYSDFVEVLADGTVNAVVIATPVYLHCEQVTQAAKAGKHVLCEKPMAATVEDCDKMISACKANNVILMLGFMKRFNPGFEKVADLIKSGRIGPVMGYQLEWTYGPGIQDESFDVGWRGDEKCGGGIFQDHGSHFIDLLRWWVGDIKGVSGEILCVNRKYSEDHAIALIEHTSGAIGTIHASSLMPGPYKETGILNGGKKSLSFTAPWISATSKELPRLEIFDGNSIMDESIYRGTDPKVVEENFMFNRQAGHFIDCIKNNKQPRVTGKDGRAAIEVINAVYYSALTEMKVKLPLTATSQFHSVFKERRRRFGVTGTV